MRSTAPSPKRWAGRWRAAARRARAAHWLASGRAFDLPFDGAAPGAALAAARDLTAGMAVDLHVQPVARRRKRLLIADMDSTIVGVETLDELADRIGRRAEVAAITAAAMAGELDYARALEARTRLFAGLSTELLAAVHEERVTPNPGRARAGGDDAGGGRGHGAGVGRLRRLRRPASPPSSASTRHHANRPVVADGRLTGAVAAPILDSDAKAGILRRAARARWSRPR